jgi:hypothetical protein
MTVDEETLKKWQSLSTIFAAIAIPLLIALLSWTTQLSTTSQTVQKDYVELAGTILKESDTDKNQVLREWAVQVMNKYSPVPFSPAVKNTLLIRGLPSANMTPTIPKELLEPCNDKYFLPTANITSDQLLKEAIENAKIYQDCANKQKGLLDELRKIRVQRVNSSQFMIINKPREPKS